MPPAPTTGLSSSGSDSKSSPAPATAPSHSVPPPTSASSPPADTSATAAAFTVPDQPAPAMPLRPPVDRAMRTLDRAFFERRVPLAAARVFRPADIAPCRRALGRQVLALARVPSVREDPRGGGGEGRKVVLLEPAVRLEDKDTWGTGLKQLVEERRVELLPYELMLKYDYWTYEDIITSILPEELLEDAPTGFSVVGHIVHLNLRSRYLPYKHLIANIIIDKLASVRTVINKIDDVGAHSEFRTFQYELLAGDPDLNVEVKEVGCTFRFDYSKVYWNSRLNTEHERLVNSFKEGEAVCDAMAGVGPFAVPAGKRRVFVWANDLNPDCYKGMLEAIDINKVADFVKPFNGDARDFIRSSAKEIAETEHEADITPPPKRRSRTNPEAYPSPPKKVLKQPKIFSHYVMNLPASATDFLDCFDGLYAGREAEFYPNTPQRLPMIHVYVFTAKNDDPEVEKSQVLEEVSDKVGYPIKADSPDLSIWDVRDVAPQKRMFCASFRLPPQVAFREDGSWGSHLVSEGLGMAGQVGSAVARGSEAAAEAVGEAIGGSS